MQQSLYILVGSLVMTDELLVLHRNVEKVEEVLLPNGIRFTIFHTLLYGRW